MTFDDETLMAFADGELDPITVKRIERAMADDPAVAAAVARHRALRRRLDTAFGEVLVAPPPDRLTDPLTSNVVPLAPRLRPRPRWIEATALAATLVAGVVAGTQWQSGPVAATGGGIVARGALARALDTRLASTEGETRILVSFRDRGGSLCRAFTGPALDGIACRDQRTWAVRRTWSPEQPRPAAGGYRQAGSPNAALMASAQEMMAGEPLDADAERAARERGWR